MLKLILGVFEEYIAIMKAQLPIILGCLCLPIYINSVGSLLIRMTRVNPSKSYCSVLFMGC